MEEEECKRSLLYLEYVHDAISRTPCPKRHSESYKELTADIVQCLKEEEIEAPELDDQRKGIDNLKTELFESLDEIKNLWEAKFEQFSKKQEEKQIRQRKQRQEKRQDLVKRCQNLLSSRETSELHETSFKNPSRPRSKTLSDKSIESEILTPPHFGEGQEESDEISEDELHKKSDRSSIPDFSDIGSNSSSEHGDPSQYIGGKASKRAQSKGSESLESLHLSSNNIQQMQPRNGSSQPNKDAPFTKAGSQGAKRRLDALETVAPKRSTRERKQREHFSNYQHDQDKIEKEKRKNKKIKPKE